ncbi:MAG: glutamine amidotransferase [Planctomycetota bacterium]|nr:glutamine amidotransferase [Planctomycetota bacterium]
MDLTLLTLNPRDRERWPRKDLASYFEPGAFDVTILGDVDSRVFLPENVGSQTQGDLQLLRQSVLDGAGLLMLGGWHSFRAGGYHRTPLAAISPVEMDPQLDRFVIQQFDAPIDQSLHLPGPLVMQPTVPWGEESEIMQLTSEGNNRAAWLQLPPLTGANRFRGIKSGARVLADDGKGHPLLATAEPGGRVAAFAGDSTWRWVMKGFRNSYQRFWRQVVLWLARKEEQNINDIWVKLDRRRFTPGERIAFDAGQRKRIGNLKNVQLVASILGPDGRRESISLVRSGDKYSGVIRDCEKLGNYTLTVSTKGEATARSDSAQFFVYTKDRELSGTTSDASLLQSMAYQTKDVGGKVVPPETLNRLVEQLLVTPVEMEEKIKVSVSFWDKWYVLVIFVGLIGSEWFLRKLWRLV